LCGHAAIPILWHVKHICASYAFARPQSQWSLEFPVLRIAALSAARCFKVSPPIRFAGDISLSRMMRSAFVAPIL
jgi:hypothetical protein